jgi:hypothetical protein
MSNIQEARAALIARILEGKGEASREQRQRAFDDEHLAGPIGALADKIARHASRITDDDMAAAKASGLTEPQLFEIVVCAAVGQAARQYDAALAALAAVTRKKE